MPEGCFALKIMGMSEHNSESINVSQAADYLKTLDFLFNPMEPVDSHYNARIEQSLPLDAVLFDIYGTLLISEAGDIGLTALDKEGRDSDFSLKAGSLEKTFSFSSLKAGLVELIREEHSHIRKADPRILYPEVDIIRLWDRVFRREFTDSFSSIDLAEAALRFEVMSNRVALMPGAVDILSFLRGRSLTLGIVSNAQFYTPLLMEYLSAMSLEQMGFDADCLSWSYRCGCGKPDQKIFEDPMNILSARGVEPGRVLYVGNDMLNDIATAASLGLKTALFAGDRRSLRLREDDERVRGVRPDFVITSLVQLKQIVQAG